MNIRTAKLFRALMNNGYIEKENDEELFSYYYDDEVSDDFAMLQQEFEFKLFKTPRRIYLIPDQSNELFLQNNADYKRSVGSDAKISDIYLYNYLAVFILHSMYGGKGNNLETREMFVVSDMIQEFSEHCRKIREEEQEYEHASEKYSIEFCKLAAGWLSKRNDIDNNSADNMNGAIMKVIRKLREEELIYESEPNVYKPTQKLSDLMPYFLSQQRVAEVNSIFERGEE
ncbi:MAG: DUF6063 family protein [Ruminococcus sp.]|nr:DUF6063 family protein [Ruminococcus sp.]